MRFEGSQLAIGTETNNSLYFYAYKDVNTNAAMTMGYGWAWFSGTVDCSSLTEYSDERMKQNITTLKYDDCKELMDNVDAKVYDKTFPNTNKEIGFIAQYFKRNISHDSPLQTLVHTAAMPMEDIGDDV